MHRSGLRRRLLALGLVAVTPLAIAACGSDDGRKAETRSERRASQDMNGETGRDRTMRDDTRGDAMLQKENFGPGCAAVPTSGAGSFAGMAADPAATAASNNPVLSTLVSAVKAAGLVDTLNGPGPFTIFAPTNDAFGKIDPATLDAVLADPAGQLTSILTYHVVSGQRLDAATLADQGSVATVNGGSVTIERSGDTIRLNGQANVVCGNVKVANAVVHIIDTVLMPMS